MAMKASKTAATSTAPRACGVEPLLQRGGIGRIAPPDAVLVETADGAAQRAAPADRLAELDRQAAQHRLGLEVAARARDLAAEHLRNREVLHQRDDVGERLVETPARRDWSAR